MAIWIGESHEPKHRWNMSLMNKRSFTDVAADSFAKDDIPCIYGLDITTGTSATTYSPDDFVTREQMAAFLARVWRTEAMFP